ncbi:MAG: 5'-methylthioadenosine/S-adenosylhomocysteine nucleosidase [Pseudoflavonifractor sp.]|nr:5'-methylthioadenosine/S-adenosylhomocysteine nucleosidase [Alloprevotella sp.]MCM1117369.1 5'-methylthioadenosine/S-adenosylhomocysteine nucleosidase [Pseudoflavonifractor sp.]
MKRYKRIAILAAMDKEVALLRDFAGKLGGADVIVTKSGIGKVNAALATRNIIDSFRPGLVISTGVAGGTGHQAGILDVVVANRLAYHDVWCGPGTEPCVPDGFPPYFTPSLELLALPSLAPRPGVMHGLICSGDSFISRPEEVAEICRKQPDVMAVEMESTAIAHACAAAGVPMIAVRVVSDTPGAHDDNASQYENFWEAAPQRTFAVISALLSDLTSQE